MQPVTIHETHNPTEITNDKTLIYEDMRQHRKDVYNVLNEIAWNTYQVGLMHDWTKNSFFDEYYQDIIDRQKETDFKNRDWYKIHTHYERHHINARKPNNVNLIDIIEMIADCIVTGKATNKDQVHLDYLEIPVETLIEAYWNTIELICDNTIIQPNETKNIGE